MSISTTPSQFDTNEHVDAIGRFDPQERSMMRRVGIKVVPTELQEAEPSPYSYEKTEYNYLKNGWPDSDRLDALIAQNDPNAQPTNVDDAERLLSQRFGAVYRQFSEEMRSDLRVIFAAVVESTQNFRHVPQEVAKQLPPEFYIEALRKGTRGWILGLPGVSDPVKRDPAVQRLAVAEHAANLEHCIDPSEEIHEIAFKRDAERRRIQEQLDSATQ